MKLSIIVPAYNEEKRIGVFFDKYLPFFCERYGAEVEFIVVVNGSVDQTESVVRRYAESRPQMRVIVDARKIGKGGALMLGFDASRGDLVGFVDADGSTPPEAFEDLVTHIAAADVVIASRWIKGAVITMQQPLSRRISSRLFNGMVNLLFNLGITDTQCGAKVLRQPALRAVMPLMGVTSWAFDVDFLFQLHRLGYQITERPTVWEDVGGSQLKIGRASLEMFVALIRLRLLHSPLKWVVTVYDYTIGQFFHISSH